MSNIRAEHMRLDLSPLERRYRSARLNISFSGGRTSALMTKRLFDAFKGTRRQHDAWAVLRAARVAQMVAEQAERDRRKGLFRRLLSWGRSNA